MGTRRSFMVSFVGVPYTTILVAATIPAILYYLGVFLQIDGYAAQRGLRRNAQDLLPRARHALAMGWPSWVRWPCSRCCSHHGLRGPVPYWVVAILLLIALSSPA
ncbi:TRAP transporter large permease subunit [Kocuria rhizophila]|nr:TRAP transporter large permease subunit [Kocuria rhizophila]